PTAASAGPPDSRCSPHLSKEPNANSSRKSYENRGHSAEPAEHMLQPGNAGRSLGRGGKPHFVGHLHSDSSWLATGGHRASSARLSGSLSFGKRKLSAVAPVQLWPN